MRTTIWQGARVTNSGMAVHAIERTGYAAPAPGSVTACYGTTPDAYAALAQALNAAPAHPCRFNQVRFSPTAEGVQWEQKWSRDEGLLEDYHAPYLATCSVGDVRALVEKSMTAGGNGAIGFGLDPEEKDFLQRDALAALVRTRLEQATARADAVVTFGLKCFGLGDVNLEWGDLIGILLQCIGDGWGFSGFIHVLCCGFDINREIVRNAFGSAAAVILDNVNRCAVRDRLSIEGECYYGDLTDPRTLPAMVGHGPYDLAVWRNTHVMVYGTPWETGTRIVAGLRRSSRTPGILLVREATSDGRRMFVRELVA